MAGNVILFPMFLITEWIVMMKVFQKEIYIVIYKALKILGQYQPKKKQKNRKVLNVLVSKLLCNIEDLCALLNHAQERKVC